MNTKNIRDLMVSLDEYPQISSDATVYDAIMTLDRYQVNRPPERQAYRAVLVADSNRNIVGKIGQLAFLKALEPRFRPEDARNELEIAGVSDDHISTMMDSIRLVMNGFTNLGARAKSVKVSSVMHPVAESIDIESGLAEAVHKLIEYQTLSLLVMEKGNVVGLIRLSDLLDEITREIRDEK